MRGEESFWVGHAKKGTEVPFRLDFARRSSVIGQLTQPLSRVQVLRLSRMRRAIGAHWAPMKNDTLAKRLRNWSTRCGSAISTAIRTSVSSLIVWPSLAGHQMRDREPSSDHFLSGPASYDVGASTKDPMNRVAQFAELTTFARRPV